MLATRMMDGDSTHLYDGDGGLSTEWSVNLSESDTRTMKAVDVAIEFHRGTLTADGTYVWRDGMSDWIPLGQCDELQAVIGQYGGPSASSEDDADDLASTRMADSSVPMPSVQPPEDLASTRMVDSGHPVPSAPPEDLAATRMVDSGHPVPSAPAPASVPAVASAPPPASVREEDVFAAARPGATSSPPPSQGPKYVGQRNEESSLFSLDSIIGAAQATKRSPAKKAGSNDPLAEVMSQGSNLNLYEAPNIHAPPSNPPPAPRAPVAPVQVPPQAPVQAPISVPAQAPASAPVAPAPSVPPPGVSAPPGPMAPALATPVPAKKKGNVGLIVAAIVVVTVIVGGGAAFLLMGSEAPPPAPEAAAPAEEPSPEPPEPADEDPVAEAEEDEASDDGDASDAPFDKDAARSALTAAAGAASQCKEDGGPTGKGKVTVTFDNDGKATSAKVGPPFAGTDVGQCAEEAFEKATVPAFEGKSVTVAKSFVIK